MELKSARPDEKSLIDSELEAVLHPFEKTCSYVKSDPEVALQQARKTAEAICSRIFIREISTNKKRMTLEEYLGIFTSKQILPEFIILHFRTIQKFGNYASHNQPLGKFEIDEISIRPCIQSLMIVLNWFLKKYYNITHKIESDDIFNGTHPQFLTLKKGKKTSSKDSVTIEESFAVTDKKAFADWGDMPDLGAFFGRVAELEKLERWIVKECCRFVAIVGIGGVGKTDLSLKLVSGIQHHFDYIVWRKLMNAPPVSEILGDIIRFLSNQQEINLPDSLSSQILTLLNYLKNNRCLLILDNVESVLQSGSETGKYLDGHEGYGELFRQLGSVSHKSCLLLTSREKPQDIARLAGKKKPVRFLELKGLDTESSRKIFGEIGTFHGSSAEWKKLTEFYNGNPLALELAANHIAEVFHGNITSFLNERMQVFNDLNELLSWHFGRLAPLEREILFWFAINRQPMSISELKNDILAPDAKDRVTSTLQLLKSRLPLERSGNRFTIQPVLIEFMTEILIHHAEDELISTNFKILNTHALLKALSKDYIREIQIRLVLNRVHERLKSTFGEQSEEYLKRTVLKKIRDVFHTKPGYAAGNVLNILCQIGGDLSGCDFSNLFICQGYFREANLQNTNFSQSLMKYCAFLQNFSSILSVKFSPDGTLLASGNSDGEVCLWQVKDGQPLLTLKGHANWVQAVTFSPDGSLLASGSEDRKIKIWRIRDGRCIATLQEQQRRNSRVSFSRVWSLVFSPDGKILASSGDDETIRLWRAADWKCIATLEGHSRRIRSIVFDSSGKTIFSGSDDNCIKKWELTNFSCIYTLEGHTDYILGIALSADKGILVSASKDKTLKLWDTSTGECLQTLRGHSHWVEAVDSTSSGLIASGSDDNTVRIWDLKKDGQCINTLSGHSATIWSVSFSPDKKLLASGSYDQTIRLWDVEDWKCIRTLHGFSNAVWWVEYNRGGDMLAAAYNDGTIRIWEAQTGECIRKLVGHNYTAQSVAFSPDSTKIVSGSGDLTVKIWDLETESCIRTLEGHEDWIWSVAFSPDGLKVASGCYDRTVKIWDIKSGNCLHTLKGHNEWIWSVAFSPDGRKLASGSYDKTIKIWDVHSGTCNQTLKDHTSSVQLVAFSPDGCWLASASENDEKAIRIWNAETWQCVKLLEGHENSVWSLSFGPDSITLVSGSGDQTVKLWDIQEGKCIKTFYGHSAIVLSVSFSPKGDVIASCGVDGTLRLWDTESGNLLKTLRPKRPYENMNISGVKGLTDAQINTLKDLGAVEQ